MVLIERAAECSGELDLLVPQCSLGKLCQGHRVRLAVGESGEHEPAGYAEQIRRHRRELDVRALEKLLNAQYAGRSRLQQLPSVPGGQAQVSDRTRGHEVRLDQAV